MYLILEVKRYSWRVLDLYQEFESTFFCDGLFVLVHVHEDVGDVIYCIPTNRVYSVPMMCRC